MAPNKIKGKDPKYPEDAKAAQVQGTVVLEAMISNTGKIESLCVVSGPPMLFQAAYNSAKTFQYKPFTLNGQPREVRTTINIAFTLR